MVPGDIRDEFDTDLGDRRREQRLRAVVAALARNPEASYPEAMDGEAELEAFYRLVRNEAVDFESVLSGHIEKSLDRCRTYEGTVLAIHDSTDLSWKHRDYQRSGLGRLSTNRQGFRMHMTLMATESDTCPLGVVTARPYVRKSELADGNAQEYWGCHFPFYDNERVRWAEAALLTEKRLGDHVDTIHVMDREGDTFMTMNEMVEHGHDFVVRVSQRTRRVISDDKNWHIDELVESKTFSIYRDVSLSPRTDFNRNLLTRKAHPARDARKTRLGLRALRAEVCGPSRPANIAARALRHHRLHLNVVDVSEIDPPDGEAGVQWTLWTTLPVETDEDIARVVDIYRQRWLVEDFFKALKTGCSLEERQLDSVQTLLIAVAISIPIAWRLLAVRALERIGGEVPAAALLSISQLEILAKKVKAKTALVDLSSALRAIARLGGHLRSNGPPGWRILSRGFKKLLILEEGQKM